MTVNLQPICVTSANQSFFQTPLSCLLVIPQQLMAELSPLNWLWVVVFHQQYVPFVHEDKFLGKGIVRMTMTCSCSRSHIHTFMQLGTDGSAVISSSRLRRGDITPSVTLILRQSNTEISNVFEEMNFRLGKELSIIPILLKFWMPQCNIWVDLY